jgi:hypothetical protein
MREIPSIAKLRPDGSVPVWLAVHEAGHVMARLQLVAAWHLNGLDNPSSLEAVRVWIDEHGQPRGLCQWGYKEPLSFRYQAVISVTGPMAEARFRHARRYDCLTAGSESDLEVFRKKKNGVPSASHQRVTIAYQAAI